MKLLIVTHSMSRTGAPKVVVDIANYFVGVADICVLSINNSVEDNRISELNEAVSFERVPDFGSGFRLISRVLNFSSRKFSNKYQNISDYWFSRFLENERPSLILFKLF